MSIALQSEVQNYTHIKGKLKAIIQMQHSLMLLTISALE